VKKLFKPLADVSDDSVIHIINDEQDRLEAISDYGYDDLVPLTAAEIVAFLPESGLKLDVLLRSYDFTIDVDGQVCGLVAGDMGYEDTGIFIDDSCKNAINKEYTADEWWEFAPWQDMKDAPRDGVFILVIDRFVNAPISVRFKADKDGFFNIYGNRVYFEKWLPLPQVAL